MFAGLVGSRTTASKSITPSNAPPERMKVFTATRVRIRKDRTPRSDDQFIC